MSGKPRKILSLILSFGLIFQQAGFAQIVGQVNVGAAISGMRPAHLDKFRPLQARYFSYDDKAGSINLFLDKGDMQLDDQARLDAEGQEVFRYFLIGISLADESFWVNLRPDSTQKIIDRTLEQTGMGRVMLEADLQLKKDTALFTSPQNPIGRKYWDKLYQKAQELFGSESVNIPTLMRPWIVPGEVIIRYTNEGAYLYKATLKVMLEQDYLKGSVDYQFNDSRMKALNDYSAQLARQLIIPELTRQVNTAKRYSELRQVYYSLILAQWFKKQFRGAAGSYARRINTGDLSGLMSQVKWSKDTYFKAYQKSFKDGEYNIKEQVGGIFGQSIRTYFSGGMDFKVSSPVAVSAANHNRTDIIGKTLQQRCDLQIGPDGKVKKVAVSSVVSSPIDWEDDYWKQRQREEEANEKRRRVLRGDPDFFNENLDQYLTPEEREERERQRAHDRGIPFEEWQKGRRTGSSPVINLKRGDPATSWWEQVTRERLQRAPVPWGRQEIVPLGPGMQRVRITKEMLQKYHVDMNPDGRNIWESFQRMEEVAPLAIAGVRHTMNIDDIQDTRQVKNAFERLLTITSLGLMVKILYNKGPEYIYHTNYGHEVRYYSKEFQGIATRALAAMGFVCHVVPENQATAIWNTSTMGKFFSLVLSFCGTASHSESEIDGLKIMDYEGSQFLIDTIQAMIAIQRAILEKIDRDGYFDFYLAGENDPRITDQLYRATNNGMRVYRRYQEKTAADEVILRLVRALDPAKVHIDLAHGSGYATLTKFLRKMGLDDLIAKIDWMHKEERPDFGNIGKLQENPKSGKEEVFDLGADGTQLYEKVMPDGRVVKYFPVLLTADYPERFSRMPIGDVVLFTDMDNDRLYVSQVLPNDEATRRVLDEIGVVYNEINEEKLNAVFIPNKFFHFLHEMNLQRIMQLIEEGKIDKNRKIVVLKTLASTQAVDKWAQKAAERGANIVVINTAVGFAKLANVMYRIEGEMRAHPGRDVIITDASGKDINVGNNPIILTAWEESGGIIVGITYGFENVLGESFLAEREKSATESIFLSLALLSKLQQEKGKVNLAAYLKELYDRDEVDTPIDLRFDNKLFVPGASKEAVEEEKAGNERKNRIFGAYLSLVIAYMKGQITIEEVRRILRDIFNEEYEARKVNPKFQIKDVRAERFKNIDIDSLVDIRFTGDGVMFMFQKEGRNWFVLFRPSGTEPKLKSYGFGKDTERATIDAWTFAFTENVKGELPKSFIRNAALMSLWGSNGLRAVEKAQRMQQAWEMYGLVVDPTDPEDLRRLNIDEAGLEARRLKRSFTPPEGHLDKINAWLRNEGLPEVTLDLSQPKAMPQEAIVSLLYAIPASVYARLGRTKEEVLTKESSVAASPVTEKSRASSPVKNIDARIRKLEADIAERQNRIGEIQDDIRANEEKITALRRQRTDGSMSTFVLNDMRDLEEQNQRNDEAIDRIVDHISEMKRELNELRREAGVKAASSPVTIRNVLYIDSGDINRKTRTASVLRQTGYQVETQYLSPEGYDVVVMHGKMLGLDAGIQFLREKYPKVPIIVLEPSNSGATRDISKTAGAIYLWIPNSNAQDDLAKIIQGVLDGKQGYGYSFEVLNPIASSPVAVNISLSIGGTKIGASAVNREGSLFATVDDIKWEERLGRIAKQARAEDIVRGILEQIDAVIKKGRIDISTVEKVGIAFAGPLDSEAGVVGTPFAAPNLPLDHYPLKAELERWLKEKYSKNISVEILNDCAAAVMGELSPQGALSGLDAGTAVIIGTGINATAAKNGRPYYGERGEIRELGHNLVPKRNLSRRYIAVPGAAYVFTGRQTLGDHPKDDSGNDLKGDFEDTLSGPNIDRYFQAQGYSLRNITEKAKQGDVRAIALIKGVGVEIGQAIAAFMFAYINEDFVKHIVLVSGVSENLGKGLSGDPFISAVRDSVKLELIHLGITGEKAQRLADGIVRSPLTYERELVAFTPASSPVKDRVGGIDFTSIPILTQNQITNISRHFAMPQLSTLRNIRLDSEELELRKMIQAGISPSSQRVMEFVFACSLQNKEGDIDKAVTCLLDYFKLEEEKAVDSDPRLKKFLLAVESDSFAL